ACRTITLRSGRRIVLGDGGEIDWALNGDIAKVFSTSPAIGGPDTITLGTGDSIVIGGAGEDTITGGTTTNVILGDSGEIDSAPGLAHFGSLPIKLGTIKTT